MARSDIRSDEFFVGVADMFILTIRKFVFAV